MNDLGREARALIDRVGNDDGPSHTDRERIRRLLSASLAAASTIGTTASLAAGSVGTSLVKSIGASQIVLWLCVGGAVGTAVTAPLVLREERPSAGVNHASKRGPAPEVLDPRRATTRAPVVATGDPDLQAPPQNPRATPRQPSATLSPEAPSRANIAAFPLASASLRQTDLRDETRLLEQAQRARAQGQPDAALEVLGEYRRRFPAGKLKSESLAVEVLCLCQVGRTIEAQARAEQLVRSFPGSPLIPRLSRSCVRLPLR